MQFIIKILISAFIIAGISELAKRSTPVAAILASLPLNSVLAMLWLYHDTGDAQKVMDLSSGILWALLPTLLFFILLPLLLKSGFKFATAMSASLVIMFVGYTLYVIVLKKLGVKI